MKKIVCILLCLCFLTAAAVGEMPEKKGPKGRGNAAAKELDAGYDALINDMVNACMSPSEEALQKLDADAASIGDGVAVPIAENWKRVWIDPDYRLYIYGEDDPSLLPIAGRHAFVVLGFALQNGEMAEELIGRCNAAAAAAQAFPDSIIVCSGGATGENNPEGHTEAGLMKAWLVEKCGIEPGRIFTDENAMTTAENARNAFAILQQQQIETITVVTSSYHQKRGQTLYHALACRYSLEQDYSVNIIANYCFYAEADGFSSAGDALIAAFQLREILTMSIEGPLA